MTGTKTAIVLVHGIGDQTPRATIREFLRTLSRLGFSPRSSEQTFREPQTSSASFGYFTADSKLGDRHVAIAECYWADLSHVRTGFLATSRNFFQLIVDAPDIIYSCLGPDFTGPQPRDYASLRFLRAILAVALWIIYFPIMAINIAYAAYVGAFAIHARLVSDVTPGSNAVKTLIATSLVVAAVIFLLQWRRSFNDYFRALAMMTLAIVCTVFFFCW